MAAFPIQRSPFSADLFDKTASYSQPINKTPLILLAIFSTIALSGLAFLASDPKKEPETKKPSPTPVPADNPALKAKKQLEKIKNLKVFIKGSGKAAAQAPDLTKTKKYNQWQKEDNARKAEIQKKRLEVENLNPHEKNELFEYILAEHPEYITLENLHLLLSLSKYAPSDKKKIAISLAIKKITEAQIQTKGFRRQQVPLPQAEKDKLNISSKLEQFLLPLLIQEQKQEVTLNLTDEEKAEITQCIMNSEYAPTGKMNPGELGAALSKLVKLDTDDGGLLLASLSSKCPKITNLIRL